MVALFRTVIVVSVMVVVAVMAMTMMMVARAASARLREVEVRTPTRCVVPDAIGVRMRRHRQLTSEVSEKHESGDATSNHKCVRRR
jgi:hypothetical protein